MTEYRATTPPELTAIGTELNAALAEFDEGAFRALAAAFADPATRWFFSGQGRSGLVARMAAMRFMHAGFICHVAGEATAPSVRRGDRLLLISKSGETPVSLSQARIARAEGAFVLALSASPASALAQTADLMIPVPTAPTRQFGGSQFEQACLIVLDAAVLNLTGGREDIYRTMALRHTNLQ